MDIQKIINDLLQKINVDASLLEKFKKDPMATVKDLLAGLGLNLDLGDITKVVEGLTSKLGLEEAAKKSGGLLGWLKGLFGKK